MFFANLLNVLDNSTISAVRVRTQAGIFTGGSVLQRGGVRTYVISSIKANIAEFICGL